MNNPRSLPGTRRQLLSAVGAAALAQAFPSGAAPAPQAQHPPRPAAAPPEPGRLVLGCQMWGSNDASLLYYQRYGVAHIMASPPKPDADGRWSVADLVAVREHVAKSGIAVEMLPLPGSFDNILLGLSPARDRDLDTMCANIRAAGEAGIPALHYNIATGIYRGPTETYRTDLKAPGRGGTYYDTWKEADALKLPNAPQERLGPPAEVMWERITYLLKRIVPAAAAAKVRLAMHPPDPPWPRGFWGVDRVPGTFAELQRYISIEENPYHGLLFCQGTICEMLSDPAREIGEVIRYFGRRGKIFAVHFRNIRGRRGDFQEVFPDEGDVDMLAALRAYRECGCAGMVEPDHVPGKNRETIVFAYGYIRALLQTVYEGA